MAKNEKDVLTSNHRFWRGFGIRINDLLVQSPQGCHQDYSFTRKILKSLPGVDAEKSIESLKSLGGWCDCTVMEHVVGYDIMKTAVPFES